MSTICITIVFVPDVSDHTISEYEDGTSRPMFKKRLKTVVTRSKYDKHKQKSVTFCYMSFVLKDHLSNSSESSADYLHEISSLSQ